MCRESSDISCENMRRCVRLCGAASVVLPCSEQNIAVAAVRVVSYFSLCVSNHRNEDKIIASGFP